MRTLNLYFDPVTFFRCEAAQGNKSLRGPAWIVLGLAMISLFDVAIMQHWLFTLIYQAVLANGFLTSSMKHDVLSQLQSARPLIILSASCAGFYFFPVWILSPALLANLAVIGNRDYRF